MLLENAKCPFPELMCSDEHGKPSCPFLKKRFVLNKDGIYHEKQYRICVWQKVIQPILEKERLAKELVRKAWNYLGEK